MGGTARGHRLRTFHALAGNRALVRILAAYTLFTLIEYSVWLGVLVYAYSHGGATAAGLVATAQLVNSVVEWHASHGTGVTPLALIGKWLAAKPLPCTPSWQRAHPVLTPACVNTAPAHVIVLWQASHSRFVTI